MSKVYTAHFHNSAAGKFIAGGANEDVIGNTLRMYDLDEDEVSNTVHLDNRKGIYTSSINKHGEIAFGGNSSRVSIVKME